MVNRELAGSAIRLRTKFVVLIAAMVFVSLAGSLLWSYVSQQQQMENELREKGQVLTGQMDATWRFMSDNQDRLLDEGAYSATGSYQGLHCAIVGRSISQMFSEKSGYITRFVNFDPRNRDDEPDRYEADALNAFLANQSLAEYCGIAEYDGREVYRYCAPMHIEQNCLRCHGEPEGELDETGNLKEGWTVGDIGGAVSIVIPLDVYRQNMKSSVWSSTLYFSIVLVLFALVITFALSKLVTQPLNKIEHGVERVRVGDLGIELAPAQSSREINSLVSEFNEMAKELEGIYSNLENQVADRTERLEQANSILEEQRSRLEEANELLRSENQYKSDFLAMMSHELRTPLTAIIAFSDVLRSDLAEGGEKQVESLIQIEANGQSLLSMINDILEMSRLDAGKITMAYGIVDVGDLLALVQPAMQPLANQKGIELTFDVNADVPLIDGDFDKLRHAIINLVGNAIKFTDARGHVSVLVAYRPNVDEVDFIVADNGIGIEKKDRERIFEKFMQADSSASRKYNGTGLGLSLAKEYVELHSGYITLESTPSKGSIFTIHLPVRRDFKVAERGDNLG